MIIRLVLFLCSCLLPVLALSQQDLLSCIDPDVRYGLLNRFFGADEVVTRTLPDSMAGLATPEEFEFIGSSASNQQTALAYKTALDPTTALALVMESLTDSGWTTWQMGGPSSGFVGRDQPIYRTVCQDSRLLSVISRPDGGATFVNLSTIRNTGAFSCGESQPFGAAIRASMASSVYQYMPQLSLPEGASVMLPTVGIASGGTSGGNREAKTSIAIETQLSGQDLVDYFGQQLQEQGWRYDSGWSGGLSSGTSWSSTPADDLRIAGLLDIVSLSDSGYLATFRATALDP